MKLFSEFVAAEAEDSKPFVKEEKPKEKPLHFKYYSNEGEDEDNTLVDSTTDAILGKTSSDINKKKLKLKYDHTDSDWNVSPMKPVDYSKSQIDVKELMEPLHQLDLDEIKEA